MRKMRLVGLLCLFVCQNHLLAVTEFQFDVNGSPWDGVSGVEVDDTITVNVIDPATVGGYGGFGNYTVEISLGDFVPGSGELHLLLLIVPGVFVTPVDDGFTAIITGTYFPQNPVGRMAWFDFTVPDVPNGSLINIEQIDGAWNNDFTSPRPQAALQVIPEPMTMSLLGIGAVALLKRRRT